jgi:hypothetical protein
MANYSVTDYVTAIDTPEKVAAELETYLETVDNTKTLYLVTVVQFGLERCRGIVLHAA